MLEGLLPVANTTRALEEERGKWRRARSDRSQQGLTSRVNRTVKLAIGTERAVFERNTRLDSSELVLHVRLELIFCLLVCLLKQVFWDR